MMCLIWDKQYASLAKHSFPDDSPFAVIVKKNTNKLIFYYYHVMFIKYVPLNKTIINVPVQKLIS